MSSPRDHVAFVFFGNCWVSFNRGHYLSRSCIVSAPSEVMRDISETSEETFQGLPEIWRRHHCPLVIPVGTILNIKGQISRRGSQAPRKRNMSWPNLIDDLCRRASIKTYSQIEDHVRSRLRPFWSQHITLTQLFRRFLRLEMTVPEFTVTPSDPLIASEWVTRVRLSIQPKWLTPVFLRASWPCGMSSRPLGSCRSR